MCNDIIQKEHTLLTTPTRLYHSCEDTNEDYNVSFIRNMTFFHEILKSTETQTFICIFKSVCIFRITKFPSVDPKIV